MRFEDLSSTQKQKVQAVTDALSKRHGYDFKKDMKNPLSLNEHIAKVKQTMKIIESKSTFGSYQKNSEWKRSKLILEGLMSLTEKKKKTGPSKKAQLKENKKGQHRFAMITESELEKAELVLAARNIVDELQDMIEDLSKTKVEKLSPLVDRLKAEHGLETAESFNSVVSQQLDTALDSLAGIKDTIADETLKISGDVEADAITDMGGEDGMDFGDDDLDIGGDDELDMGGEEMGTLDLSGEDEVDLGEPEEVERELKENKFTVQITTTAGKSGKKFFETKKQMRTWLNENEDKIKKVTKVTEAK